MLQAPMTEVSRTMKMNLPSRSHEPSLASRLVHAVSARLSVASIGMACAGCLIATLGSDSARASDAVALFRSSDTVELTLSGPWRKIVRNRANQDSYPATLEYIDESGNRKIVELTVERRGKTRQRICRFPPIKLRFGKNDVKGTLFEGNKSIKMVTHCDNGRRWDEYYILEMLAYPIYNVVTDRSFRIRPLSVTYHDSDRDRNDGPRFAFLIEDDKLVANRNGLDKYDVGDISADRLEPLESSRFALFQYLIGNEDWSSLGGPPGEDCCHNAKLIAPESGEPLYALPYDFDSSGFVDAHYAAPNDGLPISKVSQRLYRGFCLHNSTLETARDEFLQNKQTIQAIVEEEPRLRSRTRSRATRYLEGFFAVMEDPELFERAITGACRK